MTVLVTGAAGFVGVGLMDRLRAEGRSVRGTSRRPPGSHGGREYWARVDDQTEETDWTTPLQGVTTVVHLAARVHVPHEDPSRATAAFRRTNVSGTLNLARQSAAAGVKRLVFVSSVKVNGEAGAYRESDRAVPADPYGGSKLEAETGLWEIAASSGIGVVVIRPPLVYGPGARANFRALIQAVRRGLPLPFASVQNLRSFVARDNLVDFIATCMDHPAAVGETFFVSDGDDMSTPTLIRRIAGVMNLPARLFPVPPTILWGAAALIGKRRVARSLIGSLRVDISKARTLLDWTPPVSVVEGLRQALAQYVGGDVRQ